jgi:predicted short-subunit dehydrogenase-like oxidoreductase (DUF2520 family)
MSTPNAASTIGILGAGRLGTTLGRALEQGGVRVALIASSSEASARALASQLEAARVLAADALCAQADVVFLTVPDDALAQLDALLPFRAGQLIVYCSGARPLSALARASACGARVGCLHPLQTFPERFAGRERFAGISCGLESSDAAGAAFLEATCSALGARAFSLRGVDRARYHAAAVLASNYVIALHHAAAEAWREAGLPQEGARAALAPLTHAAVDALSRLPLHEALTGPIARGDAETIARHLTALENFPDLHALYRALAAQLLALPLALAPSQRAALIALIEADRRGV